MSERYARHVVYRRFPGDIMRPYVSFDQLMEAVRFVDSAEDGEIEFQVIDLENIELGDMLKAEAAAGLIEQVRKFIADPPVTEADFMPEAGRQPEEAA